MSDSMEFNAWMFDAWQGRLPQVKKIRWFDDGPSADGQCRFHFEGFHEAPNAAYGTEDDGITVYQSSTEEDGWLVDVEVANVEVLYFCGTEVDLVYLLKDLTPLALLSRVALGA